MSPSPAQSGGVPVQSSSRTQDILAAQIRLLYDSANVSACVTLVVATTLGFLQIGFVPNRVVLGWWVYMIVVAAFRWSAARRYKRAAKDSSGISKWRTTFTLGAGLAGAGWGAAGVFLYPESALANQVFLIFVLGGMMLGGASLMAARPEAFLAFMIPTGLAPAIRLLLQNGETHFAMGMLAAVFTLAILITTGRLYRTIDSSLRLQFENRDLVESLQAARDQTEALNQALELRVQQRTAELQKSTERLRDEMLQRQQMEEELFRARKLESLGVLAGGIAHDFNNFLMIVQGNIDEAKYALDSAHAAHEFLDEAAGTCQRAAFLSSRLVTFAKGGYPIRRVVSIANLVMDSVQLVSAGAPVSITTDIAKDLWCAEVDPDQIGQVLHNILMNAR
jgi:signal transduction histidine kinase